MPRVYGVEETLVLLQGAGKYTHNEHQVFGVAADNTAWNRYASPDHKFSPVGLFLFWIGLDPEALDNISERHNALCDMYDCPVCSEEAGYADTSLYSKWVQEWLRGQDVEVTEKARDLLWEVETSGLPLWEWLENRVDRSNSV